MRRSGIKVNGIARFPGDGDDAATFSLYASPIQIDPEKPALPISHPSYYAAYLAKLIGHLLHARGWPKIPGRSTKA